MTQKVCTVHAHKQTCVRSDINERLTHRLMQSRVLTYFTLRRTTNLKISPHRFIQSEIKTKPDHESLFHVFPRFAIAP